MLAMVNTQPGQARVAQILRTIPVAWLSIGLIGASLCLGQAPPKPATPPGRDTLFLTWADDPTTTMTIQWLQAGTAPPGGSVAAPDTVEAQYRPVESPEAPQRARSTVRAVGPGPLYVQRISLSGLVADTLYEFQVAGEATWLRFRTAPATLDRPLVFAEGGDVGTEPIVATLHRMAASWDPLFAVVGGDLAYDDGKHLDRTQHYLRDWHAHMRTPDNRLIPMIVTIGNHEVQGGFAWGDLAKAPFYYSLFDGLFPRGSFATLDVGRDLSLILLDTHTVPIERQTDWLAAALRARKDRPHVFPVYHVPAYPSVRKEDEGERGKIRATMRARWIPLFEQHGIRVVFEHDDHAYKRTFPLRGGAPSPGGVVYLGDGNWGRGSRDVDARRPYLARAIKAYHVIRVTLEGPSARFEAFDETGRKLDEYAY